MALRGEAYKKTFTLIPTGLEEGETLDYVTGTRDRCCFKLPVLAQEEGFTDDIKNDYTSFYFGYSDLVTSVALTFIDASTNLPVTVGTSDLTVPVTGKFECFPFGFHENGGKKYIGVKIHWKGVIIDSGPGGYYVKSEATLVTGGTFTETSFTYCLDWFTPANADGTVRIDFTHNGIIGDRNDDTQTTSYFGLNWQNQVRVPNSMILRERSVNEQESVQYNNGMMEDWKSEQSIVWDLEVAKAPNWLHRYLNLDVLQADDIFVTDYNTKCPLKPFTKRNVVRRGGYEPNWIEMAKYSSVNIQLSPKYSNHRKRYS